MKYLSRFLLWLGPLLYAAGFRRAAFFVFRMNVRMATYVACRNIRRSIKRCNKTF